MTDMQGEYVVCLEVVGKDIVQAKLIFNNAISDNPLLMNIDELPTALEAGVS